jgi:NADH:ubiquinone reductase (H+-translocating)
VASTPRAGSHGRRAPSLSLTSTTTTSSGPCSIATGLLSSDEIAAPIRSILRRQKKVTVLMAEVVGVDPHARVVFAREGTVAYHYLVLAIGIVYNYFGQEEWKALAPGLASVDDADRIRGKILTAFESAE